MPTPKQRLQQAIAILERRYGPNHPSLAAPLTTSRAPIGWRVATAEAEQMLLRAVGIGERGYGPDHGLDQSVSAPSWCGS